MDIYNFAQSTLNKIVVFTQSDAQVATMGWLAECRSYLAFSRQQRPHGSPRRRRPCVAKSEFLIVIFSETRNRDTPVFSVTNGKQ
jgi:hypothetical protein